MKEIFGIPLDPLWEYYERQARIEKSEKRQAQHERFREPSDAEIERVLAMRHGPNWKQGVKELPPPVRPWWRKLDEPQ